MRNVRPAVDQQCIFCGDPESKHTTSEADWCACTGARREDVLVIMYKKQKRARFRQEKRASDIDRA